MKMMSMIKILFVVVVSCKGIHASNNTPQNCNIPGQVLQASQNLTLCKKGNLFPKIGFYEIKMSLLTNETNPQALCLRNKTGPPIFFKTSINPNNLTINEMVTQIKVGADVPLIQNQGKNTLKVYGHGLSSISAIQITKLPPVLENTGIRLDAKWTTIVMTILTFIISILLS